MQCRIAFASPVDSRSKLPQSVQKIKDPMTDILNVRKLELWEQSAGSFRAQNGIEMFNGKCSGAAWSFFLTARTTAMPAQAVVGGSKWQSERNDE